MGLECMIQVQDKSMTGIQRGGGPRWDAERRTALFSWRGVRMRASRQASRLWGIKINSAQLSTPTSELDRISGRALRITCDSCSHCSLTQRTEAPGEDRALPHSRSCSLPLCILEWPSNAWMQG
jgi:hypothetical protein